MNALPSAVKRLHKQQAVYMEQNVDTIKTFQATYQLSAASGYISLERPSGMILVRISEMRCTKTELERYALLVGTDLQKQQASTEVCPAKEFCIKC